MAVAEVTLVGNAVDSEVVTHVVVVESFPMRELGGRESLFLVEDSLQLKIYHLPFLKTWNVKLAVSSPLLQVNLE